MKKRLFIGLGALLFVMFCSGLFVFRGACDQRGVSVHDDKELVCFVEPNDEPLARADHSIHADEVVVQTPVSGVASVPDSVDDSPSVELEMPVDDSPGVAQHVLDYFRKREDEFLQQLEQLRYEENGDRRRALIHSLASYVRVDTLRTIDWAMGLSDYEEQRLALDSIDEMALTGIGARLEQGDNGLPRVKKTIPLGALESVGQVFEGDYIAGIIKPDGSPYYFDDVPMRQVIQLLRGRSGSEVRLIIERDEELFVVPVERSLVPITPPK